MIFVAFLFAITSTFDKVAIVNSSPLFYLIISQVAIGLFSFPLMMYKTKDYKIKIKKDLKGLFIVGLITVGALVVQFIAVQLTFVTYVLSLKRASAIFGVLYGAWIFKEEKILERLVGAIIMVSSVVLIALA